MPLRPTFDLYEALEIDATATKGEIISSYRRLARDHHPDKNPDNAEATANMQKINAAYEILKNQELRANYDRQTPNTRFSFNSDQYQSGDEYDDWENYSYEQEERGDYFDGFGFEGFPFGEHEFGFGGRSARNLRDDARAELIKKIKEMEEAMKRAEELRVQARDQRIKREAEVKAQAEQKEQKQKLAAEEKEKRLRKEKSGQEAIWKAKKATTPSLQRKSCLHSEFWPRQQMKSKFQCMGCLRKRGPVGFKCPYCSSLQCQSCLDDFRVKRAARCAAP
ncbi:uncharacterized protein L3040_004244 [Drepanopeziza brunnea f. sp. 'multigermtubi']|uniref:DnaJ family protein n=1 Tax=Marssonina brunnea f. sp. multigermtubi (strain MB_m1) TaxID=1072389 RepID=K1XI99_MARBU|nr:DnaJ family protein [Drepanopeziza brunnea f. sp. 'multigermtubi' MB_m1]EKD20468.1 DnaJ family protein [Drepanopeziza brunnea f. sp. 'multigermtubi' MB_m1]KAJ5042852.1 hypothetical protein L3040_004244 [Drepanopeziza brunnea f. sp. 'multigermtubi']